LSPFGREEERPKKSKIRKSKPQKNWKVF
jgi:hypothetical protein